MLVSIALTAATLCTVRAYRKGLDKTQWFETRPTGPRPRHIAPRPRRDPRCIGPRPHPCALPPGPACTVHQGWKIG